MSEPLKFYVAGCVVTVEPVQNMPTEDFGQWFPKTRKIVYDDSLEGIEKGRTIFHELLHAHCHIFGHPLIGDNETHMVAVESFYLSLFNPKNKKVLEMLRKLHTEKGGE